MIEMGIKWKQVMTKDIYQAFDFFQNAGIKPNLRALFYRLVSMNVIPNNVNAYKGLSRQLVKYRQNGTYDWDCIEDRARQRYGNLLDNRFEEDRPDRFRDEMEDRLDNLSIEALLDEYLNWMKPQMTVSLWADQPLVCEVWIEKEALTTAIQQFTSGLGVTIRPNRGYSSWTFLYEAIRELKSVLKKHEKVVVFYLGDLDPSGVDIDRYIQEVLEFFGLDSDRVDFRRICITKAQVDQYGLPPKPEDAETLAKLQRDPRTANYELDYVVELDSLLAYVPDEFREIVRKHIYAIHDRDIYNKLREQAKELQEEVDEILADYREKCKDKILNELT